MDDDFDDLDMFLLDDVKPDNLEEEDEGFVKVIRRFISTSLN